MKEKKNKKNRNEVQKRVLKLWLECSSWEEFRVKASLYVPEASFLDIAMALVFYSFYDDDLLYANDILEEEYENS